MKMLVGRLESQQFLKGLIYCIVSQREGLEASNVCITILWVLNRRGQTMAKLAVLQLIILLWLRIICELMLKTNCLFNGAERRNKFQYASLVSLLCKSAAWGSKRHIHFLLLVPVLLPICCLYRYQILKLCGERNCSWMQTISLV